MMFDDAARSLDDPEPEVPSSPRVSRTLTPTFIGRPEVHVRLGHPDGVRHRILIGRVTERSWRATSIKASHTVCGLSIVDQYYAPLEDAYEGVLCPGCFMPSELQAAIEYRKAEAERLHAEALKFEEDRAEHSRQLEADRIARREAYRQRFSGETAPIELPDPVPGDSDDNP